MAAQVLHEGGEGSSSGVEHAVAVQGAEEPVQTGENLQDLQPPLPVSLLPTKVRLLELFQFQCVLASVWIVVGCLLRSFVQDGWNYTHFVTPVSTLERDRYLSQPTLPTSPMRTSPVIVSGDSIGSACQTLRPGEAELPFQTCVFPQGAAPRPRQPCWASGDTVLTTRERSHLCNWTRSTRTTVYTSGSTQVCSVVFLRDLCPEALSFV